MKMVMAIVPRDEAPRVLDALVAAGYTATFGDSRGGVLRQAYQTLFIGVRKEALETVLDIVRGNCQSRLPLEDATSSDRFGLPGRSEAVVGGAVIFVWSVERFEAV
jgi:uncharacterized protein YaaQ